MAENNSLYGLMAEFDGPDELLQAAKDSYAAGYREMDAFSPLPIHDLSESLGYDKQRVPTIVLICALLGLSAGFGLQYWVSVIEYPLNVGGRPLLSWPSFVPVTFEVGVLFSAFGAMIGMLILNGLPRPYHPVFNVPAFERASSDAFFLCIEAEDPKFDVSETRTFLEGLNAKRVDDVEP